MGECSTKTAADVQCALNCNIGRVAIVPVDGRVRLDLPSS